MASLTYQATPSFSVIRGLQRTSYIYTIHMCVCVYVHVYLHATSMLHDAKPYEITLMYVTLEYCYIGDTALHGVTHNLWFRAFCEDQLKFSVH